MIRAYHFHEIEELAESLGFNLLGIAETFTSNNYIVLARLDRASRVKYPNEPHYVVWRYWTDTRRFTDAYYNYGCMYAEQEFDRRAAE